MAEQDAKTCRLLAGPAAISAQLALVAVVIVSLFYKRSVPDSVNYDLPPQSPVPIPVTEITTSHVESPKRPFIVWGMDVSKQMVSSGAAHIMGMMIAMIAQVENGNTETSECSWYFVVYCVDTTIGLALVLGFHAACVKAAKVYIATQQGTIFDPSDLVLGSRPQALHVSWCSLDSRYKRVAEHVAECGDYGTPPSLVRWLVQLIQFTICVVTARFCCGVIVVIFSYKLEGVAVVLDRAFKGHPAELLLFVMVVCPVLMNTGQALLQDQVLKWRARRSEQIAERIYQSIAL